jgi:AraC-like DNA-binding protein
VRQWLEVFTSRGVDRESLLAILDCSDSMLHRRDARILTSHHHEMLKFGAEATGIPGIALLAGIQTTPDNMGIVGQLMMNCETLTHAGRQIVRFASLLCETIKWSILTKDNTCDIRYRAADSEQYSNIGAEASMASCFGILQALAEQELVPLSVKFAHSAPGYSEIYEQVFGAPVSFDQDECVIRIRRADAELPIPRRQTYALDLLKEHAAHLFSKLENSGKMTTQVRHLVAEHLANGEVFVEQISESLAMSRWTLARRLKEEGTTFNELVKALRCELAKEYLLDQHLSISEASFLLGYSEPRAFQRAFKEWYQCSPSEFRSRH